VISSLFGSESDGEASTFLADLPLRKIIIWASFLGLLYLLRDFFGVIIGTFVISYIGNSIVNNFLTRYPNRNLLVISYFSCIVLMVAGVGLLIIPRAVTEGRDFITTIQSQDPYVYALAKLRESLGKTMSVRVETMILQLADGENGHGESSAATKPEVEAERITPPPALSNQPKGHKHIEASDFDKRLPRVKVALEKLLKKYTGAAVAVTTKLIGASGKAFIQVVISLIFSFMIVWDLPKIKLGLRELEHSRLGAAYVEVAPSIADFGVLLGRAFQAQTIIALVNTALTAVGLAMLGVKAIGFLSMSVFICSFIPVAGVFISTIPMLSVALTSSGGIGLAVSVIVMVLMVHAIEAYVLNPQIYSAHLKLHPLLVLIVLVLAEHTVGVWGLIIAVPFTVYIFKHVVTDAETAERRSTTVDMVA